MASVARTGLRPLSYNTRILATRRGLSSSTRKLADTPAVGDVGTVRPKKAVGAYRGGIFGFLLGFSVASAYASYRLLEEYKIASAMLQASVEELQASTEKVSTHIRRIENVEKNIAALEERSATKEDAKKARAEVKKLYDGLHVEFLDLRSHIWGIQQDLQAVLKKEATSLRPS